MAGKDEQKPARTRRMSDRRIIQDLLDRVVGQKEEIKASVSDAIRLLQMKRELAGDQLKEIEVKWVEPSNADDASNG